MSILKKLIGIKKPAPTLTDKLPMKECPKCGGEDFKLKRGTVHQCRDCHLRLNIHGGMVIDIPCQ